MSKCGVISGPYFPVFGLNTEIYCKSSYSVQIQENKDLKWLRIWTLFTQCPSMLLLGDHSFRKYMCVSGSRCGSRTAATSKMERFVIIANGFQPLTIITKRSMLDLAAVLDPPLVSQKCKFFWKFCKRTKLMITAASQQWKSAMETSEQCVKSVFS